MATAAGLSRRGTFPAESQHFDYVDEDVHKVHAFIKNRLPYHIHIDAYNDYRIFSHTVMYTFIRPTPQRA